MWTSGPRQVLPPWIQSDERIIGKMESMFMPRKPRKGRAQEDTAQEREVFRVFPCAVVVPSGRVPFVPSY